MTTSFKNPGWVRCSVTSLPRGFMAHMCELLFVVLSLVFGFPQLFFLDLWTSSCRKDEFTVVPSGPADPEQPLLLRAGACADGVVGPACLLFGGAGEGD